MVSLRSFNTKKRRTSTTGPPQAAETRESAAQEGNGKARAQERPHVFPRLEEDATYHYAGRQAIGPKPEEWARSLRNGPASYATGHGRERDCGKKWKGMSFWAFCDARRALRRQQAEMGWMTGFEPATSGSTRGRLYRLRLTVPYPVAQVHLSRFSHDVPQSVCVSLSIRTKHGQTCRLHDGRDGSSPFNTPIPERETNPSTIPNHA